MLVVTRKLDESVVIANEIEVMVLRIDRHAVRIGIKAPRHISVHRKEIFEEIKRENIAAAASQTAEISAMQQLMGFGEKPGSEEESQPAKDKNSGDQ